jgi:signal transduction histidine kinase
METLQTGLKLKDPRRESPRMSLPPWAAANENQQPKTPRMLSLLRHWSRPWLVAATIGLLLAVGLADYLTGFEVSLLIFYLLPVSLAAWFLGWRFATFTSFASVGIWLAADIGAGAVYTNRLVPVWNALIALGFFIVVASLLTKVRALLIELEARVEQRTAALTGEMSERARLEKDILEISEREQRRIGQDLHDGLGQHLTGTALAGQVLCNDLAEQSLPQAADAERIVGLIEEAIELTRSCARGLSPVTTAPDSLVVALTELAGNTTDQFFVNCEFRCSGRVELRDPATSMHLYRITQESISNAIRHGRAGRVLLQLDQEAKGRVTLSIEDDGAGLPPPEARRPAGQGLRIMAQRARMINATLEIRDGANGGAMVRCVCNGEGAAEETSKIYDND